MKSKRKKRTMLDTLPLHVVRYILSFITAANENNRSNFALAKLRRLSTSSNAWLSQKEWLKIAAYCGADECVSCKSLVMAYYDHNGLCVCDTCEEDEDYRRACAYDEMSYQMCGEYYWGNTKDCPPPAPRAEDVFQKLVNVYT